MILQAPVVCGPIIERPVTRSVDVDRERLALCRALWAELHKCEKPSPEWFATWVARVPAFSCSCRQWLREYLVSNPVDYEQFSEWAIDLHNAVNQKLGKPVWDTHS